jgi:hypothetical protein
MTIHLDHTIVPSRNKIASAKLLAEILGVPWAEAGAGPFAPVYVNEGLTLDFGPVDMQVNAQLGNVYWNEPDGHQWEMLTVSYARPTPHRA